jgi:[ribosomal protein S5]-alanine N-acetyltransferase
MNFPPFAYLSTERLVLRELRLTDANEIFLLRSNKEVNELIDRVTATSIDEAHQFINMIISNQLNNESVMWVISFKDEPKLIGTIVYWNIVKEKDQAEIGYELLSQYHGKGIMQEALLKVVDFGFKTLGLKTIVADPKSNNQPSVKLLEKCGFVKTGETEDGYLIYQLESF